MYSIEISYVGHNYYGEQFIIQTDPIMEAIRVRLNADITELDEANDLLQALKDAIAEFQARS